MGNIFNLANVIGAIVNSFVHVYIWSKLLGEKINFKSYSYYAKQLFFALLMIINFFLVNGFLRIITLFIILLFFCNIIFSRNIKESLLAAFISEIIIILSEFIYVLVINVLYSGSVNALVNSFAGTLLSNIVISILALIIIRSKLWNLFYDKLLKIINKTNDSKIVFILMILLVSFNTIFGFLYKEVNLTCMLIINLFISVVYIYIFIKFLIAENKYDKINSKYNNTLNSLKEYEEILDIYRVSNHENKNLLLTIRSMIVKNEEGIPEYIDKIIDNKIKDDEKLMFDTNAIPAGGLRAVIYSKLLVMKDKKIKFSLNVDRKVRTVELIELGEDIMLDICKIIGVFLDNAIEAVENIKNKTIKINLFTNDKYLNIEIANAFEGEIDLTKIDDKGYTSKSNGHGYGLCLVKDIINRNHNLKNERKINKKIFSQNLKIKIK